MSSHTLEGIRVLDLSRLLPGPFATQILANMGAEVIKVERPPEGDYLRALPPWAEPPEGEGGEGIGAIFASINRGKKSIVVDFSSPRGRDTVLRLAATADVFVESFLPGALERRGLGYQPVHKANPRLIYCSLSGYGQNGPYRHRPGHDVNYLALAGILGLNAAPGGPPHLLPVQISDLAGGMAAAVAILAGLVGRERTGQGEYLDVALFDAAVDWMEPSVGSLFRAEKRKPTPGGMTLTGRYPCYQVYETADGHYMSLGALEGNFWKGFCELIERHDLLGRQFDPTAVPEVAAIFCGKTRAEWTELAGRTAICLEPVLDVEETFALPQVAARGRAQPDAGRLPSMGEDTIAVLEAAGFGQDELDEMIQAGTIAVSRG
ncbi:MAG: CaiB/BaiF CoA transferase family protein [Rudaea sp.]